MNKLDYLRGHTFINNFDSESVTLDLGAEGKSVLRN